ncbi:hypothetical protein E2C01_046891 [Portunus trituberculatus]|uniref:Uncharacterized protein n=1 Tax=Portunus trituberculatus TaxID=210409 RepID=A0A5B7G7D1_PORTR|nr:hypothetical protein [Portunus trituberculatus]
MERKGVYALPLLLHFVLLCFISVSFIPFPSIILYSPHPLRTSVVPPVNPSIPLPPPVSYSALYFHNNERLTCIKLKPFCTGTHFYLDY